MSNESGARQKVVFRAKNLSATDEGSNALNREWWQNNPMTYDWDQEFGAANFSPEYFARIDQVFGDAHSLINNPRWPAGSILEGFVPYGSLKGRRVLEIGCGMGLVASHIARAGAELTAIDLTPHAVAATTARLQQAGLTATVREMNAERMAFPDESFDVVISWGVIHHSGNMQKIIDEIRRVLKPGGRAHLMIYNRNSLRVQVYCRWWLGVVCGRLLRSSLDEVVGSITDGHIARHLTGDEFRSCLSRFKDVDIRYSDEKTTILKYLFGIGRPFMPLYPLTRPLERFLARRWGWYLEAAATK